MPRITRREDEDPVPEAAQVMGELLQGDREAIQERRGVAGKKTNSQKRSGFRVPGSGFEVPGFLKVGRFSNLELGTWNMELFICG